MAVRRSTLGLVLTACVLAPLTVAAWRQRGAALPGPGPSWEADFKARNVRLLPKDLSASQMKRLMNGYVQEVGVPCEYCHVQDEQTGAFDYASDDNPTKQTARLMITMLNDINGKYLAQLGEGSYAAPITCGNCHRGQRQPPEFHAPHSAGNSHSTGNDPGPNG